MDKYLYYVVQGEEGYTEVTVTAKSYWKNNHYISDESTRENIVEFLEANGFEEVCDSTFEGELTVDDTKELLASSELFEQDDSFDSFLDNCYTNCAD
jgi:CRISPR/Cas system-associated endoribonuclease Cas2